MAEAAEKTAVTGNGAHRDGAVAAGDALVGMET